MLSSVVVFIAVISVLYGVGIFFRRRAKKAMKEPPVEGLDGSIVHVRVTAAATAEGS